MKKTYIAPAIIVCESLSTAIMAASGVHGDGSGITVPTTPGEGDAWDAASKKNYNVWEDED